MCPNKNGISKGMNFSIKKQLFFQKKTREVNQGKIISEKVNKSILENIPKLQYNNTL